MAIIDQTQAQHRAQQRKAELPKRGGLHVGSALLTGTAMVVGVIPGVGVMAGPLSHAATRMKNGVDAKRELKARTDYYRHQIAGILNIPPQKVTVGDFKRAAAASPAFRKMYDEVIRNQAKENNIDLAASAGVSAAGALGLGWAGEGAKKIFETSKIAKGAASMGMVAVGAIGGGAIGGVLSKNSYTAQELVEAVEKSLIDADERGQNRNDVLKPQTMFLLRLAQNEMLLEQANKAAKQRFHKPIHQLQEQELHEIINLNPKLRALAGVAAVETKELIANPDVAAVREVGAAATNVANDNHGSAMQARGGHVERLMASRAANNNQPEAANDRFTAREDERRAANAGAGLQQG